MVRRLLRHSGEWRGLHVRKWCGRRSDVEPVRRLWDNKMPLDAPCAPLLVGLLGLPHITTRH